MRRWLRDAAFRGLLKNSGYLTAARIASAVLSLTTLAITTRTLGPALFGLLVLVHAYVDAASGIAKFQSWQMVIRYGAPALREGGDLAQLRHGVSFAIGLDLASGLVGMVVAMAVLPLIGHWFHLGPALLPIAIFYCTLLPTMAAAAPTGILRLLDRFDVIAAQQVVTPAARLILVLIAWALGWPFKAFLLIWYATDLLGDLVAWWLALRELRRRGLLAGVRPGLRRHARHLAGAWRFALTTNLTTSLGAAWGPVANLIVGALLGASAAGQYRVAASLIEGANKPADMLSKAFYPEIVRMDLASRKPWRLLLRGAALSGGMGLVFAALVLVAGKPFIAAMFGHGFDPAFGLLVVMIFGLLLTMVGFPLGPMLYAVHRPGVQLRARIVSATLYLALIYPLAWAAGLTGAGIAYVGAMLVMTLMMVPPLLGEYRRRMAREPLHAA